MPSTYALEISLKLFIFIHLLPYRSVQSPLLCFEQSLNIRLVLRICAIFLALHRPSLLHLLAQLSVLLLHLTTIIKFQSTQFPTFLQHSLVIFSQFQHTVPDNNSISSGPNLLPRTFSTHILQLEQRHMFIHWRSILPFPINLVHPHSLTVHPSLHHLQLQRLRQHLLTPLKIITRLIVMIFHILIHRISSTPPRNKIMRSKSVILILPHELQLPHHLINKLRTNDIKRTLSNPMNMWLTTLPTLDLPSPGVKQYQIRIMTVHRLLGHPQYPIQYVKLTNDSLLAFLPIPFDTSVIDISLKSDSLVLDCSVHGIMHVMSFE